ncbi:MAG: hypothetical protein ACK4FJ_20180 [Ferrovibrio sp.]|uniref:hypothetical protein n=1 Tax=Ferrovibrio sp. TaxID=1917215 RepID=UPI00391CFEDE
MKKQKLPRRKTARMAAKSGQAKAVRSIGSGETPAAAKRELPAVVSTDGKGQAAAARFHAGLRTRGFRLAFLAFLTGAFIVAASLVIPHEFAFFELGYLFTLSIYDLVLAMLGLSIAIGLAERRSEAVSILLAFIASIAPMLLFFDPIFHAILQSPLGHELFLIAPVAVMLSGLVLWLPASLRRFAAPVSASIVGFSLSLFIGLDDFGIGIKEFAFSAVFGAVWILAVPGLMLRPFRGAWLTIPARIIGSWLMVIAVIVTVSLYVPFSPDAPPLAPPLADPTEPDGGTSLDAPALPPLDPAVEEGLMEAPESFDDARPDGGIPAPDLGGNPLLGGGRSGEP